MNFDASVVLALLILVCILILLFISFVNWYIDFLTELKYLNTEIKRCTGRERAFYKKKRRRLFLSIIPFVSYER